MKDIKDILIIGTGPTGLYAWYCAQLLGFSGYIIEQTKVVGGQTINLYKDKYIYDLPCVLKITGQDIIDNLQKQINSIPQTIKLMINLKKLGLEIHEDYFTVTFDKNKKYYFKTILITSGNGAYSPIKAEFKQELDNVLYVVKTHELQKLHEPKIMVLGGGDSAVDWVNHLHEKKVTNDLAILHRRPFYRAKGSNTKKMDTIHYLKQYKGYILDYDSAEIIDNKLKKIKIESVISGEKSTIEADVWLVQYGTAINLSYIIDWPIKTNIIKKILINKASQTNVKNIFAAGDAAGYEGKYYNLTAGFGEVVNAIYNIARTIKGENYYPNYFGENKGS